MCVQVKHLIASLHVPPLCSQIDSMPNIEFIMNGYKFVVYPRDYMVFVDRSCSLGVVPGVDFQTISRVLTGHK